METKLITALRGIPLLALARVECGTELDLEVRREFIVFLRLSAFFC